MLDFILINDEYMDAARINGFCDHWLWEFGISLFFNFAILQPKVTVNFLTCLGWPWERLR